MRDSLALALRFFPSAVVRAVVRREVISRPTRRGPTPRSGLGGRPWGSVFIVLLRRRGTGPIVVPQGRLPDLGDGLRDRLQPRHRVWLLIGCQFTLAEFIGGPIMIVLGLRTCARARHTRYRSRPDPSIPSSAPSALRQSGIGRGGRRDRPRVAPRRNAHTPPPHPHFRTDRRGTAAAAGTHHRPAQRRPLPSPPTRVNRPGSDGGSQSMKDESHVGTQEVQRRAA